MSRLSAVLQTAVEKKVIQAYESLYLDIDGGIYITNAPMNITIGANEYISVGQFLGFSSLEENRLFTTSEITISMAGIPAFETGESFLQQVLQFDYVDKEVKIYRSFFDHDSYIDSFLMFKGRVDAPVIDDDPSNTTTVACTCSSHWVDYERTNGVITNNNRQQQLYAGDVAFQYASDIVKDIQWKP